MTRAGADATLSLILPTRGRVAAAERLLESVAATADRPDEIEVVLYVDADDFASHSLTHPAMRIVRLIRPQATMGVMTNECYAAAAGRSIMLINDDVVFKTRGWDSAFAGAFAAFPDEIALVWGNDLFRGGRFPSHPCLSRRFCEIAGGPCPAEYIHDYIDTHIFDVFRILRRLGHDRLVYLPGAVIEHCCREVGKAAESPAASKRHSAADQQAYIGRADQRELLAWELADRIREGAGKR